MREAVRRRLAGDVPLAEAFYFDMLGVGSMVNIAIGLCDFAMIAADFPIWLAIIVFLSPLPYNLMLVVSVWRAASLSHGRAPGVMKAAAIIWFAVMFFV